MGRIKSVDVIRLLAITAVIVIHTSTFKNYPGDVYENLFIILNQLSRFAVPFFFVIAGYFWGKRIRSGDSVTQVSIAALKRLLTIFVVWSLVYLLPYDVGAIYQFGIEAPLKIASAKLEYFYSNPTVPLLQGTDVHLWFLVSLICAVFITTFFVKFDCIKSLLLVATGLYIFGLVAKPYLASPLGIDVGFDTRNGPFFSTLLFVSGYFLSKYNPGTKWLIQGVVVFLAGSAIHFSEIYYLWSAYNIYPTNHDFVVGTYLMGIGMALIALSNHKLVSYEHASFVGRYTLGIYVTHYFFVTLFFPLDDLIVSPVWEMSYVVLVLLLSVLSVYFMSKNKYLKRVVM